MALPERKLVTSASLAVDVLLCIAFFTLLFGRLRSHVQSHDPKMIALWAGLTAACLTAVFWLAIQMFRVVLRAQREAQKKG
jgi:hypothetical protein